MMSTTEYYFMFSEGVIKNNEVICCSTITELHAPAASFCLTYWDHVCKLQARCLQVLEAS